MGEKKEDDKGFRFTTYPWWRRIVSAGIEAGKDGSGLLRPETRRGNVLFVTTALGITRTMQEGAGATCYRGDAWSGGGLDARLSSSAASLRAGDGVQREVEGRRRSKGAGEWCSRAMCGQKAGCGGALGASRAGGGARVVWRHRASNAEEIVGAWASQFIGTGG